MAQNVSGKKSWPLFRSLGAYQAGYFPPDLIAGLTLAAIAIPEQMATARLGGFAPQIGFYAFIAGSFGFALLGANRFLSCGADSTITPIFAGGLALLAASGSADHQALAAALALMVGIVLVAGGVFRFGGIANLLSTPVTVGFLAGISVHILVSQMPGVLGVSSPTGPMLERIGVLAQHLGDANIFTLGIGFGVLAVVAASEALSARIPGALIGLIAATAAVILADLEHKGVSVVGTVSGALPTPTFPDLSLEQWARLVPLSLLIAIVVMVQTAATTRSFPSDPDKPADVDRDFLGAGAGSILAGLFSAFPVNASPPRTGIVAETGGQSQLSGLIAAALVLTLLAFGAALLKHVPDAALGGVLLFVALRIIRFRQIATIYRQSFPEFLLVPPRRRRSSCCRSNRAWRSASCCRYCMASGAPRVPASWCSTVFPAPPSGGQPTPTSQASMSPMWRSSACRRRCRSSMHRAFARMYCVSSRPSRRRGFWYWKRAACPRSISPLRRTCASF
jgi:SulP family sulfate permease